MAHLGKSAMMLLRRIRAAARRGRLDDELRDEIRQHLELRRQQLIASGMDPQEARAAALRGFGNPTRFRDEARDVWTVRWLEATLQDIRYGTRLLWRAPAFTAFAVLSLAAGIGAAAAVFNVADAVLLRPLPVRAPYELREFHAAFSTGPARKRGAVTPKAFQEMQRAADFAELIAFRPVDAAVIEAGGATRAVRAQAVSGNYFRVLGVAASVGRTTAETDGAADPMPVVLGERLWRSAFGGDASIAGRTIMLNGRAVVVVGVTGSFRGLVVDRLADVFVPLAAAARLDPAASEAGVTVVARLRPDVSAAVAEQRMAAIYKTAGPPVVRGVELRVTMPSAARGVSSARAPLSRPLWIGLALAGVLLLLACANTGGLLVARFAARQGEFGVRIAIGAGRARLARQLVVEALLVAAAAAAAGLLIAGAGAPLLLRSIPVRGVVSDFDVRFDWRLVAFTIAVSAAAALAAAAASVLRIARSNQSDLICANTRSIVAGRRRATRVLIAAQVACSLILVVGAGSMARSLVNLQRVDPGFDPAGVLAIDVDATGRTSTREGVIAYHGGLLDRLSSAVHVARASVVQFGLMTGSATLGTVHDAGGTPVADSDRYIRILFVGPGFFETVGMRVIAGRGLEPRDASGRERVAVVSRPFADFYLGGPRTAIDRLVNSDVRIIGVVDDVHLDSPRDEPARAMFVPFTQAPPRTSMTYVVRTVGDPVDATASLLETIRAYDSQLKPRAIALTDQIATTMSDERFLASLGVLLASIALFLSCAGLYAAVAYSVWERRTELAVRLALGATARDVVGSVLGDPLKTTVGGVLTGIPAAYLFLRAASALLFDVSPLDPVLLLASGAGLLGVALAAALWPARRAGRIDPVSVLRNESWA